MKALEGLREIAGRYDAVLSDVWGVVHNGIAAHPGAVEALASFQDEAQAGLLDGFALERLVLNPDRDVLRARIARRFSTMLDHGAVQEVRGLLALQLDPQLPAMKAIGVPEITAWLAGELPAEEAIERAVIATRQYAKRQRTWFRSRMADWTWIAPN